MKCLMLVLPILLLLSCGSPLTQLDKFPVKEIFSYQSSTHAEGEILSEMIPSSTVGINFEELKNNGTTSSLEAKDDIGLGIGSIVVNNMGWRTNENRLRGFIATHSLDTHKLHYLFLPLPNPIPKKNVQWAHKQKIVSAMIVKTGNFEDTFKYKIVASEGNSYTIKMSAKVGAMSMLSEDDNVSGEYKASKKNRLG